MEDLLASIRKAINEDIGDVGQGGPAPQPDKQPAASASRSPAREPAGRPRDDQSVASNEIQQLREKISRSRAAEAVRPRDPEQRAASLAAALRSDTPRRSWREIEAIAPPPPPPPPPQPVSVQPAPIAPPPPPRPVTAAAPPPPAPRMRSSIHEAEPPRQPLRTAPRFPSERPQHAPVWPPGVEEGFAHTFHPREGQRGDPAILSGSSVQAVQSAFGRLADSVLSRASGERSIEDMTRDLLRVMLKQWLDENLPPMVERLVREEIERVARTGR